MKTAITILWLVAAILTLIGCIYYVSDSEFCAYCIEQNSGHTMQVFCDYEYDFLKEYTDSLIQAGYRINQNWICEIR